ncbi:predicted protein [Nematostella vectensis]|uniref:Uncharacterized protein n=1 Tax=Nematostella vectensis TaxID=45351 RepID=A7SK79_NEMVE|nr:predicted protein [Nematostella vectensis]|eukprot:XP_001627972.1 predicted protein [Nematostella vectensis]
MPARFAGRRASARARMQNEKNKREEEAKKSEQKAKTSPRKSKSLREPRPRRDETRNQPESCSFDYDQALRKLAKASEILERSTTMERDVSDNLEKIQEKLGPEEHDEKQQKKDEREDTLEKRNTYKSESQA